MGRAHEVRKVAMAKTAAKKAKLYSRYGKEIYLIAKAGGPEPDGNLALRRIIEKAKKERKDELKIQDKKGSSWYLSENMAGIMLYVDKFSENLKKFESKIDYLAELGITYVHFMPLLKSREGNDDGGYAVSDYLNVKESLGDMRQLERVIGLLKKKGINTSFLDAYRIELPKCLVA